jgi:hypothetical protein
MMSWFDFKEILEDIVDFDYMGGLMWNWRFLKEAHKNDKMWELVKKKEEYVKEYNDAHAEQKAEIGGDGSIVNMGEQK